MQKAKIRTKFSILLQKDLEFRKQSKKALEREGAKNVPDPENFDAVLEDCKNAFEDIRYAYEEGKVTSFFAGVSLRAVREVITEMHPQWLYETRLPLRAQEIQNT